MGIRSAPLRSASSPDGSSAERRERRVRVRKHRRGPWPCRARERPATCARPSPVAALSLSPGSPHGQASAIAARRASFQLHIRSFAIHQGNRNLPAKTTPTLDSDSGKWSSLGRDTERRGFRTETFGGLFLLRAMLLLGGLKNLSIRRVRRRKSETLRITRAGGELGIARMRFLSLPRASLSSHVRRC